MLCFFMKLSSVFDIIIHAMTFIVTLILITFCSRVYYDNIQFLPPPRRVIVSDLEIVPIVSKLIKYATDEEQSSEGNHSKLGLTL